MLFYGCIKMLSEFTQRYRPTLTRKVLQQFWFQTLTFNIIWALSVVFNMQLLALLVLVINLFLLSLSGAKWQYLLAISCIGLIVDGLLTYAGLFEFNQNTNSGLSLIILWVAFAQFSLAFFKRFQLSPPSLSVLSVFGGASSYYLASLNNAVLINWLSVYTITFILFWLIILPLAHCLYRRFSCVSQPY